MNSQLIEETIVRLMEGSLSVDEHQALLQDLLDRPELADRVVRGIVIDDLMNQHVDESRQAAHAGWIAAYLSNHPAGDLSTETEEVFARETFATPKRGDAQLHRDVTARLASPGDINSSNVSSQSSKQPRRIPMRQGGIALCVAFLVGLASFLIARLPEKNQIANSGPFETQATPELAVDVAESTPTKQPSHAVIPLPRLIENSKIQCLAVVESVSGEIDPNQFVGKEFFADDHLLLPRGSVSLRFPSGISAILSGPANLKFVSPSIVRLNSGRFTASVEALAKGFTVITPHADVVDLGTRFGVNVDEHGDADVLVFDGIVDVHYQSAIGQPRQQSRRLSVGEALRIKELGEIHPLTVIEKGPGLADWSTAFNDPTSPIARISDNFVGPNNFLYYAIVRKGFDEDALAYVDRPYEWNSFPNEQFPEFLRGADYIQTINSLKWIINLELSLELRHDAEIYVLMDDRVPAAEWLRKGFEPTGLKVGMDEYRPGSEPTRYAPVGPRLESAHTLGKGPGKSVDLYFNIWKKTGSAGEVITLGSLMDQPPTHSAVPYDIDEMSMYGIVVLPQMK